MKIKRIKFKKRVNHFNLLEKKLCNIGKLAVFMQNADAKSEPVSRELAGNREQSCVDS